MDSINFSAGESPTVLLIIAYFGVLPACASLFFRSCAENPSINWLLVTDQRVEGHLVPDNVTVRQTTMAALRSSINRIMGMKTALRTPYKLIDFKPAYGVIFADDVAGFDWWGHCDMDLMFGDIRNEWFLRCGTPGSLFRTGSAPGFEEPRRFDGVTRPHGGAGCCCEPLRQSPARPLPSRLRSRDGLAGGCLRSLAAGHSLSPTA